MYPKKICFLLDAVIKGLSIIISLPLLLSCSEKDNVRPTPVPEAVDMGTIVDGKNVKWASFNLGASKPEEFGTFYAWGETMTKLQFNWESYKFGKSESGPFSRYDGSSGTMSFKDFDYMDDAARSRLHGNWRVPTEEEWQALMKCKRKWVDDYNGSGVKGIIVEATNGNTIFLPASGYRDNAESFRIGEFGAYWSSSISLNEAYYARFVSFSAGSFESGKFSRHYGLTIRPVTE